MCLLWSHRVVWCRVVWACGYGCFGGGVVFVCLFVHACTGVRWSDDCAMISWWLRGVVDHAPLAATLLTRKARGG